MLLALRLQQAGIDFLEAQGIHGERGLRKVEILCPTKDDAKKASDWAQTEGVDAEIRVATEEELEEHKKRQELL